MTRVHFPAETMMGFFSFPLCEDWLWGLPSLLSHGYRSSYCGVKCPGHEADHSPPFSAKVNMPSWCDAEFSTRVSLAYPYWKISLVL